MTRRSFASKSSSFRQNGAQTSKRRGCSGTELLQRAEHLYLLVPCVLVPFAWNVLLNPAHPDIARCAITAVTAKAFDPRLIR